jgi:opacity protein-like surface antigen
MSMKKSFVIAGLGALMAASALSGVQADERWPRWYVGLTGDYTYMQDQDISNTSKSSVQMENGWGVGGEIGYLPSSSMPLVNALRFEAEVTYHENKVSRVNLVGGGQIGSNGANYSTTAYMANMFYDLPTGSNWSPYIGGGMGMASIHLPTNSNAGNTSSTDNEFAYQGLVGIGYSPDTIPNTQWSLGYRYLATSDAAFGGSTVKYSTNNVEVGAKFRF